MKKLFLKVTDQTDLNLNSVEPYLFVGEITKISDNGRRLVGSYWTYLGIETNSGPLDKKATKYFAELFQEVIGRLQQIMKEERILKMEINRDIFKLENIVESYENRGPYEFEEWVIRFLEESNRKTLVKRAAKEEKKLEKLIFDHKDNEKRVAEYRKVKLEEEWRKRQTEKAAMMWTYHSETPGLTEAYILEHKDKLDMKKIQKFQDLTLETATALGLDIEFMYLENKALNLENKKEYKTFYDLKNLFSGKGES